MNAYRKEKIANLLQQSAASFFQREALPDPLITVTGAELSKDLRHAKIYLSIFPEDKEAEALAFAKRKKKMFADYLKEHTRMQYIPKVTLLIDVGEKNRRRIQEIDL